MDNIKRFGLRIPFKVYKKFCSVAEYEGRSINSQIVHCMKNLVEAFETEHGTIKVTEKE